jgi:hypothetical protein
MVPPEKVIVGIRVALIILHDVQGDLRHLGDLVVRGRRLGIMSKQKK